MITVEHIETAGWEPALRGMRNPLDSWDRADSLFDVEVENTFTEPETGEVVGTETVYKPAIIGPNDESLMRRLIGQGRPDHCKFRRMLAIYADVTAPLYWWKEFDTYKVGTVANSCSTMHTLMKKPFDIGMFSYDEWAAFGPTFCREDGMSYSPVPAAGALITFLNYQRDMYLEAKSQGDSEQAKHIWRRIIQLLPESWNQKRTVMLNYEVMANIYKSRRNHKLREWRDFIDAMVSELPYPWIFTGEGCSR